MHCPITLLPIIRVCELKTCLHMFETAALFYWAHNHDTCPVCRTPFDFDDIVISPNLQRLINSGVDASTQTESCVCDINTQTGPAMDYFRIIDLDEHLVNPYSQVLGKGDDYVERLNRRFSSKIGINRYVYQCFESSSLVVARNLARTGYLIYDIFRIGTNTGLHRYMIYSHDYLADGSLNRLSIYRKIKVHPLTRVCEDEPF